MYSKLLAGASWMGEYGDPDTDDWQFLRKCVCVCVFERERERERE